GVRAEADRPAMDHMCQPSIEIEATLFAACDSACGEELGATSVAHKCVEPARVELGLRRGVDVAQLGGKSEGLLAIGDRKIGVAQDPMRQGPIHEAKHLWIITESTDQAMIVLHLVTGDALVGVRAGLCERASVEVDLTQDAMTMQELVGRMRPCRSVQARSTMLQSFIEFAMDVKGGGKTQMGHEP